MFIHYVQVMFLYQLTFFNLLITLIQCYNINPFIDYDNNYYKESLRSKFLNKKKQKEKIELFDKLNSNKSVFVDNILHLERNDSEILEIEDSFRNLLTMRDYKYVFKRDFFWRTYRAVEAEPGNITVVCYRCQNANNIINDTCNSGGYWIIEEKAPPCPYEIFSLITDWQACVADYTQFPNVSTSPCPSTIAEGDLMKTCDNPIKTRWRITRNFTVLTERNSVICQGRESCEILTLYTCLPNSIVFRIINSTNHIFYSRVMKSGNKNYICIDDCGAIDPAKLTISKNEQPFRLDLFKKYKREYQLSMPSVLPATKKTWPKSVNSFKGLHLDIQKFNAPKHMQNTYRTRNSLDRKRIFKSECKRLQEKYYNMERENAIDY